MGWVVAVLLSLLAACGPGGDRSSTTSATGRQPDQVAGSIAIVMDIEPLTVGMSRVTARVSDDGAPLIGAAVEVRGDMTHAGMPPALDRLREDEPGTYVSSTFGLPMAGDWLITVEVTAADGRRATSETFVSVAVR